MKYIDKNDVDISKLFKWGRAFELEGRTIYMRIIGDGDMGRSKTYALRKSAELRKKLKDTNSDEYIAFIPELNFDDTNLLIESLILIRVREITSKALDGLDLEYPKDPGEDATLEEQEKYQLEVDLWPERYDELVVKATERVAEEERKKYKKLTKEQLEKEYYQVMVEKLCENEMYNSFQDAVISYACYVDENYKTRLFDSVLEVDDLPMEVKTKLNGFYGELTLDIENLKKSPEATQ